MFFLLANDIFFRCGQQNNEQKACATSFSLSVSNILENGIELSVRSLE